MYQINQDPRVMAYFPSLQDKNRTKRFIQKAQQHFKAYGYTFYAVDLIETNIFIGFVGLFHVGFQAHFTPAIEIGWRLSSNHWNKGYATEAAQVVLHHGFIDLHLNEIVSLTVVANAQSRHVMEKIGMHHNIKDNFNHPKIESNSPVCYHVLYRLARNEYL